MIFSCITEQNIPRCYGLSFVSEKPALRLLINEEITERDNTMLNADSPIIAKLMREYRFTTFSKDFSECIGFDDAFKKITEIDGFLVFEAIIPPIETIGKDPCGNCQGTGEDKDIEDKCTKCGGSGKSYDLDWRQVEAISATLTVFLVFLNRVVEYEKEVKSHLPQLLVLYTETNLCQHGGSLGGQYSIPFCDGLRRLAKDKSNAEAIEAVMKQVHDTMYARRSRYGFPFMVWIKEAGGLVADCPGNACGIHPDNWSSIKPGRGYDFSCHNVDTAAQQLMLLSALAALQDIIGALLPLPD